MDDSQCTVGGHRLCLLVFCILAFITPAHTHGAAAAGATTLSNEEIWDLRTTVDKLKAFSKAEKKVIEGIHHSLAVNAETVSRLEETLEVLKEKATLSVEGIQDLRTTVEKLEAFGKAEKEMYDGIHHSLTVKTDKIAGLEETLQVLKDKATTSVEGITELRTTVDELKALSNAEKEVKDGFHRSVTVNSETVSGQEETLQALKDKVKQLEQKQTAEESRIALKAELTAHFVAIFDETQVNQGPIKFKPSYITRFGSNDGEQRELSANCGSSKWKEDAITGRCYYIPPADEWLSWSNANKRCQMEGGQLVSIGSPEEQNFINGMKKDSLYPGYWTGGRRIQGQLPSSDATGWEWSDGSPFNFTNWDPSRELYNAGGHQDCISFRKSTGRWWDNFCTYNWRPFCEKPGIISVDGVFTAPISGVYELGFTAWTPSTMNGSMVDIIHNNNRIIASASSKSVGKFGTNIVEELKVGDKVAVFLSQGAIGGQSERRAKFSGKLVQRS